MSYAASLAPAIGPNVRETPLLTIEPHGWPIDRQFCQSVQVGTAGPADQFVNQPPTLASPLNLNLPHGQGILFVNTTAINTQFSLGIKTRELAELAAGRTFEVLLNPSHAGCNIGLVAAPGFNIVIRARDIAGVFTGLSTPVPAGLQQTYLRFLVFYSELDTPGTSNGPRLNGQVVIYITDYPAGTIFLV